MENKSKNYILGYGLSFLTLSIFNGLLVAVKETNPGVKDFMADFFGHHWTTHGVFVLVMFFVLGYLFSRFHVAEKWLETRIISTILFGAILGTAIIAIFYLTHL